MSKDKHYIVVQTRFIAVICSEFRQFFIYCKDRGYTTEPVSKLGHDGGNRYIGIYSEEDILQKTAGVIDGIILLDIKKKKLLNICNKYLRVDWVSERLK